MDDRKLTKLDILINEKYENLSKQEKKIADFIRKNQDSILHYPVAEISKLCNVSQAAVVRFCKQMGFSGMKEFKIFYQNGKITGEDNEKPVRWDDDDNAIFNKTFTQAITTLEKSFGHTDLQTLSQIADIICEAGNIDVFGIGGSAIVASHFKNEFMRLGKRVNSYNDQYVIDQFMQTFQATDLVVIISRSGENKPLLEIAKKAKNAGTKIIAITCTPDSSLTEIANLSAIAIETQFFANDRNSYSRLTQIAMISCLYIMSAIRLGRGNPDFKNNYFEKTNYKKN